MKINRRMFMAAIAGLPFVGKIGQVPSFGFTPGGLKEIPVPLSRTARLRSIVWFHAGESLQVGDYVKPDKNGKVFNCAAFEAIGRCVSASTDLASGRVENVIVELSEGRGFEDEEDF